MKKGLIIALFPLAVMAKGNHKVDTTPSNNLGVWTVQIEENYYHITNDNGLPVNTNYINAAFGYSFRSGLDLQLATYNCPLSGGGAQNFECDTYINSTQSFALNNRIKLNIGSQTGFVFSDTKHIHMVDFGLLSYSPFNSVEMHSGVYYANVNINGAGFDIIGFTGGFVTSFGNKLRIEGDYFDGHNNLSGAQLSFFYDKFYVGLIVPETNSVDEFAGVLGFKTAFEKFNFWRTK